MNEQVEASAPLLPLKRGKSAKSLLSRGETLMETPYLGSCLCGDVQFRANRSPLAMALCHCRICQKQSGSAFSVIALFPASACELTGATQIFRTEASDGAPIERSFCRTCGSPIMASSSRTEEQGVVIIKAPLLDRFQDLKPTMQIFCDGAVTWLGTLDAVPSFPAMPPR